MEKDNENAHETRNLILFVAVVALVMVGVIYLKWQVDANLIEYENMLPSKTFLLINNENYEITYNFGNIVYNVSAECGTIYTVYLNGNMPMYYYATIPPHSTATLKIIYVSANMTVIEP